MSGYNRRKRSALMAVSYKSGLKVPKAETSSKPILVVCYDIVRDVFGNFNRNTLCRMLMVNKRFKFIIEKEFNNSAPFIILPELQYAYSRWTMDIGKVLTVPVDLNAFQKIVASKFIRFQLLSVICNMSFQPMQLLDMRHVWENGDLRVNWTCVPSFRPTEEFNCAFSNCNQLFLNGCNAISMLYEMNGGKYRDLIINDNGYDPISQDIPWTKITDFLFRPVESSESRNSIDITTDRPSNRENTIEFFNSVKERFLSSVKVVNFDFALSYSDARLEIEKVHNNRTNQNLIYGSYESSVHLHTLAVGDTPDESISSYDDDSSDSSSNYDDDF